MKPVSGKLKNFRRDARQWGWGRAVSRRIAIYFQRIFGLHIYRVGIRDLHESVQPVVTSPDLEFRHLELAALPEKTEFDDVDLSDQFLRASLRRGDRIHGAFKADKLIGYAITASMTAPHSSDVWVEFEPGYTYMYKVFVHPEHRGQKIGPAIILVSDETARSDGFKLGLGFISIVNFASLAMGKSVPGSPAGFAGYVKLGSWFRPFSTRGVKRTGFGFVQR